MKTARSDISVSLVVKYKASRKASLNGKEMKLPTHSPVFNGKQQYEGV